MSVENEFVECSVERLSRYIDEIEKAVARLRSEQVWARESPAENSIGNLLMHLEGNIRQWVLGGVGGQTDVRTRSAEFAARDGSSGNELVAKLRATVDEAIAIIRAVKNDELTRRVNPQKTDVSVLVAIYKAVEHFSGHTGQILFATKRLLREDLGFSAKWNAQG